jgi:hypothetical protein
MVASSARGSNGADAGRSHATASRPRVLPRARSRERQGNHCPYESRRPASERHCRTSWCQVVILAFGPIRRWKEKSARVVFMREDGAQRLTLLEPTFFDHLSANC